jgi:GntR family transcriptional regulator
MTATLPGVINRDSPVPFYFQLAELLEEEITSTRWKSGQRLPSEPELCRHYGVSRTTIRQALARLEQEGLLRRAKGRGTFVDSSRPRSWLIQSTEGFFHDEFLRTGHRVTSKVLRLEQTVLPAWASGALRLPPDNEGVVLERIRAIDGLTALYVVNYLPPSLAEVVLGMRDPHESLYRRLAEKAGVRISGGRRFVEAVTAGSQLAGLLEVEPGDAIAYVESVSWAHDSVPFDCYQAWLRTDRMRIDIAVSSGPPAGIQLPDLVATRKL